jgi:hypothetical protein
MKAGEIRRAEWNPRELPERNEGKAREALKHFGWLQPVTWNAKTKTLLDGHMRLDDLPDDEEVPVYCVWVDPSKEKMANVALNKSFGEWMDEGVSESMKSLGEEMVDLDMAGFGNETGKYLFLEDWKQEEDSDAEALDEYEKKHKIVLEFASLAEKIAWEQFTQRAGTVDAILESMREYEHD